MTLIKSRYQDHVTSSPEGRGGEGGQAAPSVGSETSSAEGGRSLRWRGTYFEPLTFFLPAANFSILSLSLVDIICAGFF